MKKYLCTFDGKEVYCTSLPPVINDLCLLFLLDNLPPHFISECTMIIKAKNEPTARGLYQRHSINTLPHFSEVVKMVMPSLS